jgi:alkanesulfonate monooxygenase SsuD/methylene tetrahydromethanopterin reductase-like flavin-dependent oxidoreductase (luciferase family)
MTLRYALDMPLSGDFSDLRLIAELAHEAEDSGWDGFFVWDHILMGAERVADTWVTLTAIAMRTNRILLGPMVTPLVRRTPWKLARECVSLDHLTNGRLILGVGAGSNLFTEMITFDHPLDDRTRAEMLDEGLAVLLGLWSGERFSFEGKHYRILETTFLPKPCQKPRIPIWVAASWPRKPPLRRAARFEGVLPVTGNLKNSLTPGEVCTIRSYISGCRMSTDKFDIAVIGSARPDRSEEDTARLADYADAGTTWWLEAILPWQRSVAEARQRIRAGPPRP